MSHQRFPTWLALVGGLVAGPVLAVQPPGPLYIKAKNTHVKASPDPAADTLAVLQPGQEVTYLGRAGATPWCRVKAPGQKGPIEGVVFQSNLGVSPPSREVTSKNPLVPLSPEAFASSGAAIKAVGPGTLEYGKTLGKDDSAQQLQKLVALAKDINDVAVAQYATQGGLPEVVGTGGVSKGKAGRTSKPAPVRTTKVTQ